MKELSHRILLKKYQKEIKSQDGIEAFKKALYTSVVASSITASLLTIYEIYSKYFKN